MSDDTQLCSCGSVLSPGNPTGVCAECSWWQRNAELGGDPVPIGEVVDLRHGLANAIALLRATVVEEKPVIVLTRSDTGRYRVIFDYDARAVALLKDTVPSKMRRWIPDEKCWEISSNWTGPLAGKLRNAGFDVVGLDETTIAEWFGPFVVAAPVSDEGNGAYRKGLCVVCTGRPPRPGGIECEQCFRDRLIAQHRIRATLARAELAPYPEALPAMDKARKAEHRTYAPLEIDPLETVIEIENIDHAASIDTVIAAHRDHSAAKPPCVICGRRPAKGAVVHIACRRRLEHAVLERPFLKARNAAFQAGLCTICMARPCTAGVACTICAGLISAVWLLRDYPPEEV